MDWVAGNESWNLRLRPITMNPSNNVIDAGYRHSNAISLILTAHQDLVDQDPPAFQYPQLEQTAVRVVGNLHYGINTDFSPSQVAFQLRFDARVVVAQQVVGTSAGIELSPNLYDMATPWVANEDFLWHYHARFNCDTDFWADSQMLTPDWRAPQKVPMDIRVSRRLKQREVLALFVQCSISEVLHSGGDWVFEPSADIMMWADPQLRTLVRTIT